MVNKFSIDSRPPDAVCANFAHTASSFNSPDSNMLPKCLVMTLLSQSNNVAIAFCVHHTFSSLWYTSTPCSLFSIWKIRNSAVLFLISCLFAIIGLYQFFDGYTLRQIVFINSDFVISKMSRCPITSFLYHIRLTTVSNQFWLLQ